MRLNSLTSKICEIKPLNVLIQNINRICDGKTFENFENIYKNRLK